PVSRAVAQAHAAAATPQPLLDVQDFAALPGRGVRGRIGPPTLHLGNLRLMRELGVATSDLHARMQAYEEQGQTAIALTDGTGATCGECASWAWPPVSFRPACRRTKNRARPPLP